MESISPDVPLAPVRDSGGANILKNMFGNINPFKLDIEGYLAECGLKVTPEELENYMRTHEWATHGPTGKENLHWKLLKDCETEHLENILITQPLVPITRLVILSLLKERWGIRNRFLEKP